jgi:eukaryotic-like serine/threonine-protein kinase
VSAEHDHLGLSLPGYTLSTKLGAGGYGEVWLAHAPGGLTKAVKFIFGSYHDKRAEHELRALQKVKEVRHPFLLSLERIEVVDGRLVIVTELADSSLKDRFDECTQQGQPGVPRAELLSYLHDAADALDFLSQKHTLQHLDVKPENLLLLAGHVKVADFGLVKDVGKSQASLVGGLTPLYSAPEVFQGSPSKQSDQYSLAVLYQEMLTGVLPFDGATAAELTLQHLHDEPDLSPLPAKDRYILSRALAKEPSQRFNSCVELIEALQTVREDAAESWTASGTTATAFESAAPTAPVLRGPGRVTELFGDQASGRPREVSTSMLLDVAPLENGAAIKLPALELSEGRFTPSPALVIGVGGAAGEVVKLLRHRIAKQFGDDGVPAIQLLLLDSDAKAIGKALQGDARSALKPDETLALALRRPQEYREQSDRLMRWLSRRWLYNIPRSLRTEGMRPLGRLAFADHSRQVVQRIRMALSRASEPDAMAASSERTALEFRGGAPRVYVVASISGGAGSGMSLDVGYAVRTALDKMNAVDAPIVGIFLHAAGRDPRHCDLAKVNSYAWLTEYNHLHRAGGAFPGDDSCGMPPLPAGRRAFDAAYLVDVEIDAEGGETSQDSAAKIAEYLYLDALTPAQSFLDQCREAEPAAGVAPLRTFSLSKLAAASDDAVDRVAAVLSHSVVSGWSGGVSSGAPGAADSVRDTNQIVQGAATLVGHLQLKLEGLASNARSLIESQFNGDQHAIVAELVAAGDPTGKTATALGMIRAIDCLFAPPSEGETGPFILQRPLDAIISPLSMKLAGDLAQWVVRKLDDRQERLAGAQRAAQWLVEHMKCVEADALRMADGLARQAAMLADGLRRDARAAAVTGAAASNQATAYLRMRIDHQAVWASTIIARRLLAELKSIGATMAEFGRHLKHMAANLPGCVDDAPPPAGPLGAALTANLRALTDEIDGQLQKQFIDEQGGLFPTIMGNSRVRAQMLVALGKLSRRAAELLAAQPEVSNSVLANVTTDGLTGGDALPPLLACGGVYRRLAVVPSAPSNGRSAAFWKQVLGDDCSVTTAPGNDLITVCEGWRLPLVSVALDLIQRRRDYADFAARVQTRSDIAWAPLTSPAPLPIVANAFCGLGNEAPTVTQVL